LEFVWLGAIPVKENLFDRAAADGIVPKIGQAGQQIDRSMEICAFGRSNPFAIFDFH
jgi:hypothetical protein